MPASEPILLEYTSAAFLGRDVQAVAREAQDACTQYGFRFGIQIHNAAPQDQIRQIEALGLPLSVHAPLVSPYLINLAAEDIAPAQESLRITLEWMEALHASLAVFHGFVMTDTPLPTFNSNRSYQECMRQGYRPELGLDGTPTCRDFFGLPEFRERTERLRERLGELRTRYPNLCFAIENDFPLYGAGFLLAEQAAGLENPLCLDTGHLWASAHIFDRDFLEQVRLYLATGQVRAVHLHASKYKPETPKTKWGDGHQPLSTPNAMALDKVVAECKRAGVRRFTLEIPKATAADIHAFAAMYGKSG